MTAIDDLPHLIALSDAARRVGLSRYLLTRAGERGEFRIHQIGTRYFVEEAELRAWLRGAPE